jgi:hypothetical protein
MVIKADITFKIRQDLSTFDEGVFESLFIETTDCNRTANTNEQQSIIKF